MTWAKGFLRLWVVASLVWIALSSLLVRPWELRPWERYALSSAPPEEKGVETVSRPNVFDQFDKPQPPSTKSVRDMTNEELTAAYKSLSGTQVPPPPPGFVVTPPPSPPVTLTPVDYDPFASPGLFWVYASHAQWVLLPPLGALLAGVSLGWILRGFRRPT